MLRKVKTIMCVKTQSQSKVLKKQFGKIEMKQMQEEACEWEWMLSLSYKQQTCWTFHKIIKFHEMELMRNTFWPLGENMWSLHTSFS